MTAHLQDFRIDCFVLMFPQGRFAAASAGIGVDRIAILVVELEMKMRPGGKLA